MARRSAAAVAWEAEAPRSALATLTEVRRVSVAESVSERLMALIHQGRIRPGERLPTEQELMARLKVGRSSVREAVRSLALLGVVETRPRIGTVVISPVANRIGRDVKASIAGWALRDVFEVRLVLEQEAAALASIHATAEHIAEIRRHAEALERKVAKRRGYFRENVAFHLAIAAASRNGVLRNTLAGMIDTLRDLREALSDSDIVKHVEAVPQRDVSDHRAILAAIALRDAEAARASMAAHLNDTVERFERARAGEGEP